MLGKCSLHYQNVVHVYRDVHVLSIGMGKIYVTILTLFANIHL